MSLLSGLINYWKMDEPFGTRRDSHSYQGLASNNLILSGAGIIYSGAVNFPSGDNFLFTRSHAITGNMSISLWVKLNKLSDAVLLQRYNTGTLKGYTIDFNTSDGFRYYFTNYIGEGVATSSTGGIYTGQWNHILSWYDLSEGSVNMKFNNNSTSTAIIPTTGPKNNVLNAPLIIGSGFSGVMGPLEIWNRILSTGEQFQLFSGTGTGPQTYSAYTFPTGVFYARLV